jgi:hypothetical protein
LAIDAALPQLSIKPAMVSAAVEVGWILGLAKKVGSGSAAPAQTSLGSSEWVFGFKKSGWQICHPAGGK